MKPILTNIRINDIKVYFGNESRQNIRFDLCYENKTHIQNYFLFSITKDGLALDTGIGRGLGLDVYEDNSHQLRITGVDDV